MADTKAGGIFYDITLKGLSALQSGVRASEGVVKGLGGAFKRTGEDASAIAAAVSTGWKRVGEDLRVAREKLDNFGKAIGSLNLTALGTMGGAFNSLSRNLQNLGGQAAGAFGRATGFIRQTVQAADPLGFERMGVALFGLNIQLGRFFVPLIKEATSWIQKLTAWFQTLTPAQHEQVYGWIKIGLAVTGVLSVLPRLFGLFSTGATVIRTFASAFTLLTASTPIGWVLGIVAALAGLAAVTGAAGTFEFADAWNSVQAAIMKVWEVAQPLVQGLMEFGQSVLPLVVSTFTNLGEVVGPVVSVLSDLAGGVLSVLTTMVRGLSTGIGQFALILGGIILLAPKLAAVVVGALGGIQAALTTLLANPIALTITALVAVVGLLAGAFGNAGELVAQFDRRMNRLQSTLERIRAGAAVDNEALNQLDPAFRSRFRTAQNPQQRAEAIQQERVRLEGQAAPSRGANLEALQAQIAANLQAQEGANSAIEGTLTERRQASVRRAIAQSGIRGITPEQEAQLGRTIGGSQVNAGAFGTGTLGQERREQLGSQVANIFRESRGQLEIINRLRQQGGNIGDRFRGEMRQQPAEFVSIVDAWRKAMTSDTESPEAQRQRLQLAETQGFRQDFNDWRRDPQAPPRPPIQPG